MLNGTSKAIRTNESYRATSYSRVRRPATSSSSEPGDSLPRRTQIQGSAFCIRGVRAAEGFSESPTRSLYRLIVEIARQITGEPPSVKSTTRPQRCRVAWQVDRVLSFSGGLNRSCSRSLRYGAIALLPSPRQPVPRRPFASIRPPCRRPRHFCILLRPKNCALPCTAAGLLTALIGSARGPEGLLHLGSRKK